MTKNKFKSLVGMFELLLAFTFAGSTIVACKLLSKGISLVLVGFLSMLIALLVLLPLQYRRITEFKNIKRNDLFYMFLQSITGLVLTRMFTLFGLRYISVLDAGLINSLTPGVMLIFSIFFLKERPNKFNNIGVTLSILGLLSISLLNSKESNSSVFGYFLIIAAVFCEVLMTIFRKKARTDISSLTNTTTLFILSIITLLPFLIFSGAIKQVVFLSKQDWIIIFYYGLFGSALAYILWGRGVLKISGSLVSITTSIIPITAITLSILILGEKLSINYIIGSIMCITGMVLSSYNYRVKVIKRRNL